MNIPAERVKQLAVLIKKKDIEKLASLAKEEILVQNFKGLLDNVIKQIGFDDIQNIRKWKDENYEKFGKSLDRILDTNQMIRI